MDSQVPRPALNNLAPSTPELLAFWVGNLLSAKFQEFQSVCEPGILLFFPIAAV